MASLKFDQTNRVKNIRNKFEVLNEQSNGVDKTRQPKSFAVQRGSVKSKGDPVTHDVMNNVMSEYNGSKDKFGPSCNFGNRKRLKENNACHIEGERSKSVDEDTKEEGGLRKLSRQFSDPTKKLHRTPAFRCDKSEKLKEAKNAVTGFENADRHDRLRLSREKLKMLGTKTEELLKEDELTFSKSPVKMNEEFPDLNDPHVPQHILDMYAKVSKPKGKTNHCKFDNLFSDSGVSSESENLLPDDIDEIPKVEVVKLENPPQVQSSFIYPANPAPPSSLSRSPVCDDLIAEELEFFEKNSVTAGAASADTLRKVLNQPLPQGPPPKKPPRTFAAVQSEDESSDSKLSINELKSKLKNTNKKVSHRSREESRLMLEKIENSLKSGKILSPRLKEKRNENPTDDIGKFDTHPSTAHLKQSPSKKYPKSKNKKKEEIHYMCTDLLSQQFIDKNNLLNSSDGSVTSYDDFNSSSSFVNCFNSLNCSGAKKNSGIFYSKFGSTPSSNNSSFTEICCSCNKERNRSEGVRLSTFFNPNSLDADAKCKVCGLNEKKNTHFKCHLDCTCTDDKILLLEDSPQKVEAMPSPEGSQYGALVKSKSQEHIYDEPVAYVKPEPVSNPLFTRSRTQLEDSLIRTRSSNVQDKRKFSFEDPGEPSPFVRNDFKSKTVGRFKTADNDGAGNKVRDILRRLEGNDSEETNGVKCNRTRPISLCEDKPRLKAVEGFTRPNREEFSSTARLLTDDPYDIGARNSSFDESPDSLRKKPPLYDKKNSLDGSRNKRPQRLELKSNDSSINRMGKSNTPVDVDRQNLNKLMAELYDTVTAVGVLNSPASESVNNSSDIREKPTAHDKDSETDDPESLQNVRKLTEKRKRYVRRVTTLNDYVPPKSLGSFRYISLKTRDELANKPYNVICNNSQEFNFEKLKSMYAETESRPETTASSKPEINDRLFEMCALIGINFNTGQAYTKYVFPEQATLPEQILTFIFPDFETQPNQNGKNNSVYRKFRNDTSANDFQLYSIVLTNEYGVRSYCYCRRVVPEGLPFCLPLAYCIITTHRAPSFYYRVLGEIESHHGFSDNVVKSILTQLYEESFPKPGHCIQLKYSRQKNGKNLRNSAIYRSSVNLEEVLKNRNGKDASSAINGRKQSESLENMLKNKESVDDMNVYRKSTDLTPKFTTILSNEKNLSVMRSLEKIYGENLNDCKNSWKNESVQRRKSVDCSDSNAASNNRPIARQESRISAPIHLDGILLRRSMEPRFDEDNLTVLFDSISVGVLIKIFGTLLIERKVILVCNKLSKLSSCIEGLQSILYPFVWQHTLISTIPAEFRQEIFGAPVPMIAGIYLCDTNDAKKSDKSNAKDKKENCDISKSSLPNSSNDSFKDLLEDLKIANFDEGMVINLSCPKQKGSEQILKMQSDESTLLPPSMLKILRAALQHGPCTSTSNSNLDEETRKSCNILVSEAFLRFFTDLFVNYKECLNASSSSDVACAFEKETLIKKSSSKHVQYFLDWFTETAMFKNFIENQTKTNADIPYPEFYEVFEAKIKMVQSPEVNSGSTNGKNNYKTVMNKKIKVLRDKLRDFMH